MSIRPIDMQAYVPKVDSMSRETQTQQNRFQGETQNYLQNLDQQINIKEHQVQTLEKSEHKKVTRDNKDKEEEKKRKKRRNWEPNKGSKLDILS